MTDDWMIYCVGRSFGLHGAGKRGAAVVPVYGVRALCMMLAPPWLAGRSGRGESACGGGSAAAVGVVACAASSVRWGNTVTFLTAFGWFLARLGGSYFPFGVARWWPSAFFESCFSIFNGCSTILCLG